MKFEWTRMLTGIMLLFIAAMIILISIAMGLSTSAAANALRAGVCISFIIITIIMWVYSKTHELGLQWYPAAYAQYAKPASGLKCILCSNEIKYKYIKACGRRISPSEQCTEGPFCSPSCLETHRAQRYHYT
jgi:hypothetical protein